MSDIVEDLERILLYRNVAGWVRNGPSTEQIRTAVDEIKRLRAEKAHLQDHIRSCHGNIDFMDSRINGA